MLNQEVVLILTCLLQIGRYILLLFRAIMVFFLSPVLSRLGLGMSWQHTITVFMAGLNGNFNILMGMQAAQDLIYIDDENMSREDHEQQIRLKNMVSIHVFFRHR